MLAVGVAAFPAGAGAVTLGSVTTTAAEPLCKNAANAYFLLNSVTTGPSYVVPAGGGLITSWETSFGESGAPLTMVILRRTANPLVYTVVGSDKDTLPSPIPAGHISTFTLGTPLAVQAGDLLGVAIPGPSASACYYPGVPGDTLIDGPAGPLSGGESLTTESTIEQALVNVSAELLQSVDLSLTESVTPASGGPGVALISLAPGGPGPGGIPATVTDIVPTGETILAAAVAGDGSCTVAGQSVSCALGAATLGSGAPVIDIIVSSTAPGSYTNQALITPGVTDSNPANNTASGTIIVSAPNPPVKCTVIALRGATLSLAETALKALHCKVGKINRLHSKTVHKGLVMSTSVKPGTSAPAETAVAINVSSGRPKPKKHHH